jgi:hypothetical protein
MTDKFAEEKRQRGYQCFGSRRTKKTDKNREKKNSEILCFEVLDVLF